MEGYAAAIQQTPTDFLSDFPHITETQFVLSIESFHSKYAEALEKSSYRYAVTRMPGGLQLAKDLPFEVEPGSNGHVHEIDAVAEEHDEARLNKSAASTPRPSVIYHIIFSPIYRVPVLYFELISLRATGVALIDWVFRFLVPDMYRSQIEDVGVMGGITMAENPVTGRPALFIHPCNTAAALSEVSGGGTGVTVDKYIELWIGLVGGCVGLEMPIIGS